MHLLPFVASTSSRARALGIVLAASSAIVAACVGGPGDPTQDRRDTDILGTEGRSDEDVDTSGDEADDRAGGEGEGAAPSAEELPPDAGAD